MDDLDETELQNPFPSPPSHYNNYTTHNLNLLELLRERTEDIQSVDVEQQRQLLSDQTDVPDFPLCQLEKPRVDWIREDEDGYYDVFGDRWFVKERIPTLAELGGMQLYPVDPATDRRPALNSIMRSMLVTYSSLTKSLLDPPPLDTEAVAPEWQRHIEWLNILSQNLMAAANDLRPVQARENLENMMKSQLSIRREETKSIHEKCDALEVTLAKLRESAKVTVSTEPQKMEDPVVKETSAQTVSLQDLTKWAEEVS